MQPVVTCGAVGGPGKRFEGCSMGLQLCLVLEQQTQFWVCGACAYPSCEALRSSGRSSEGLGPMA